MSSLPPGFAFAAMVPELLVSDLDRSLSFWCDLCGFTIAYDRPEDRFAYLHRDDIQVMLEEVPQSGSRWITGSLERPFGRGINFQLSVVAIDPILSALRDAGWSMHLGPEERWYRAGDGAVGVRQFLVQDPDGYLIRFSQPLGLRPQG